ncbi:hypothetical protein [Desertivirga brevis]|uniref:hypothetical protein n=1 Tax=Desertivirga brevis TaxID=2810310 RepID=UPI001A9718BA|nr:hypothetical protein [Pedobacter sp. SYSU D00873]
MRIIIYALALSLLSCNNYDQKISNSSIVKSKQAVITANKKNLLNKEICWVGNLNGTTPIFIHYQRDSNLLIGEITYLNTRAKLPIRLLGTIEEDDKYRLLEFDETEMITGIIEGIPKENVFKGSWFSPKTKKELQMNLLPKDTVINNPSIKPDPNQLSGNYHYQYGEYGYNGDFEFNQVGVGKAAIHILSLTNLDRGPNIAEVDKDTIPFYGNNFIYNIPESDNCEFKVTFYKGFVYINYTKGYCGSQFGHNATIDGIYLNKGNNYLYGEEGTPEFERRSCFITMQEII